MNKSTGSQIELNYRGLKILVNANHPAPLLWIEEFCRPALKDDSPTVANQRVELTLDPDQYAAFLRQSPVGTGSLLDCFTLDGEFDRHPLWRVEAGGNWIHHVEARCMIWIGQPGEDIRIIAESDRSKLRSALLRVVRELATLAALKQGDLFIHAAAVVIGGQAILLAGQKRSGKTSMLINALRQPGVSYLSNDRILIQFQSGAPIARAMPTIVKIRPESLQHLPDLPPPADSPRMRCFKTIQECLQPGDESASPGSASPVTTVMSPAQLSRWLGVRAVAQAPLGAILYPRVDTSVQSFQLQPLSGDQAADRLAASRFPCGVDGSVPQAFRAFGSGPHPAGQWLEKTCHTLARRIQSIDCRIGPAAFAKPNIWNAIVELLTSQKRN